MAAILTIGSVSTAHVFKRGGRNGKEEDIRRLFERDEAHQRELASIRQDVAVFISRFEHLERFVAQVKQDVEQAVADVKQDTADIRRMLQERG